MSHVISDDAMLDFLRAEGIDADNIRIDSQGNVCITITAQSSDIPELPNGYAYKGGAARFLLTQALGLATDIAPRDLDITRIDQIQPDGDLDDAVSQEFMPDDYAHGHGVDVVYDIKEYLTTRDFTINEVYASRNEIVASKACVKDTIDRVIRLSEYEKDMYYWDGIGEKMAAKSLRLLAESSFSMQGMATLAPDLTMPRDEYIRPFFLALHLNRAWERGEPYADAYFDTLREHNQLPPNISSKEEALYYLHEACYSPNPERRFEFTGGAGALLADKPEAWYEQWYEVQDAMGQQGKSSGGSCKLPNPDYIETKHTSISAQSSAVQSATTHMR